jgi:hypothetical protein
MAFQAEYMTTARITLQTDQWNHASEVNPRNIRRKLSRTAPTIKITAINSIHQYTATYNRGLIIQVASCTDAIRTPQVT